MHLLRLGLVMMTLVITNKSIFTGSNLEPRLHLCENERHVYVDNNILFFLKMKHEEFIILYDLFVVIALFYHKENRAPHFKCV